MRRIVPVLVGLGLAGCLEDIPDDCQTDADCGPGARCVLEGVRICQAIDGGAGGTGGTDWIGNPGGGGGGGFGGFGGEAGAGGSGGDVEVIDVPVTVDVWANEELAAFLAGHDRAVREVVLRVTSGGQTPVERRLSDPPGERFELPARGAGEAVRGEVTLPLAQGEAAVLTVEVEAFAGRADGSTARFAVGHLGELVIDELPAEGVVAEVELQLVSEFDFDGDGAGELNDCAPEDPAVHPGALDVCDGVDTDCAPEGICTISLPAAQSAKGLACTADRCLAATDDPGDVPGWLVSIDTSLQRTNFSTLAGPRGAAINPADSNGATAITYDADPGTVRLFRLGNPTQSASLAPGGMLSGLFRVSPRGRLAFAAYGNGAAVDVFDAIKAAQASSPTVCTEAAVGGGLDDLLSDNPCGTITLNFLSDASGTLPLNAVPNAMAVRHGSSLGNASLYLTFEGDERVAVVTIEPDGDYVPGQSGLLAPFTGWSPGAMALNGDSSKLYVIASSGSGSQIATITTSNNFATHVIAGTRPLPVVDCGRALAVRGSELLIADACAPALLTVPLDEAGLPVVEQAQRRALPADCNPAGIELLGTGAAARPLVHCAEAAYIPVIGAD